MEESNELEMSSLEAQLVCLYADRERLECELGTADSEPILSHIRSLEDKLRELERSARDLTNESGAESEPDESDFAQQLAEVVHQRETFFERMGVDSYEEVFARMERLEERAAEALKQADEAERRALQTPAPAAETFEQPAESFEQPAASVKPQMSSDTLNEMPAVVPAKSDAERVAVELRALVQGLGTAFKNQELRFNGELSSGSWSFFAGNGSAND